MSEQSINSEDVRSITELVAAYVTAKPKATRDECAELFCVLLSECATVKAGKVRYAKYSGLEDVKL